MFIIIVYHYHHLFTVIIYLLLLSLFPQGYFKIRLPGHVTNIFPRIICPYTKTLSESWDDHLFIFLLSFLIIIFYLMLYLIVSFLFILRLWLSFVRLLVCLLESFLKFWFEKWIISQLGAILMLRTLALSLAIRFFFPIALFSFFLERRKKEGHKLRHTSIHKAHN